ncbi:hypothetical protein EDB83DRAFT_371334 [Lactarius deliciosus]|nr:hypothetical protein EDB83DRAFT_371334 [Lactarius deliciosus]
MAQSHPITITITSSHSPSLSRLPHPSSLVITLVHPRRRIINGYRQPLIGYLSKIVRPSCTFHPTPSVCHLSRAAPSFLARAMLFFLLILVIPVPSLPLTLPPSLPVPLMFRLSDPVYRRSRPSYHSRFVSFSCFDFLALSRRSTPPLLLTTPFYLLVWPATGLVVFKPLVFS